MVTVPEPVLVHEPVAPRPRGSALGRGLRALARGELPARVKRVLDHGLRRAGWRHRRVLVGGLRFLVRRDSWDEGVLRRVIGACDYLTHGLSVGTGDTVIDVGANIGAFSVLAGRGGARVLAYEPDRENYALLVRNVARNGLAPLVSAHPIAVGEADGETTLFRGPQGALHTTVPGRLGSPLGAAPVPVVSLASVFAGYRLVRCDFLKLDCEGAEYGILDAAPVSLLRRVRQLAVEWHAPEAEKRERARHLAGRVLDAGFTIVEFTDFAGHDCGFLKAVRQSAEARLDRS